MYKDVVNINETDTLYTAEYCRQWLPGTASGEITSTTVMLLPSHCHVLPHHGGKDGSRHDSTWCSYVGSRPKSTPLQQKEKGSQVFWQEAAATLRLLSCGDLSSYVLL